MLRPRRRAGAGVAAALEFGDEPRRAGRCLVRSLHPFRARVLVALPPRVAAPASRRRHCSAPATIPASRDRSPSGPPGSRRTPRAAPPGTSRRSGSPSPTGAKIAPVRAPAAQRLAPDGPLGQRRALVQVHRDPCLDEHRLGQREVRVAVAVGDRHLPELAPPRCAHSRHVRAAARTSRAGSGADTSRSVSSAAIAGAGGGVNIERRTGRARSPARQAGSASSVARRAGLDAGASRGDRRILARRHVGTNTSTGIRPAIADEQTLERRRSRASPTRAGRALRAGRARLRPAHRPGRRTRSGAARMPPGSPPATPAFSGASVAPSSSRRDRTGHSRRPKLAHQPEQRLAEPRRLRDRREIPRCARATSASSTRSASGGSARRPRATSAGAPSSSARSPGIRIRTFACAPSRAASHRCRNGRCSDAPTSTRDRAQRIARAQLPRRGRRAPPERGRRAADHIQLTHCCSTLS